MRSRYDPQRTSGHAGCTEGGAMFWRNTFCIAIASAAICARAYAAEPRGADPVLAEVGQPIFQRYCAACHGIGGRGDGPSASALRKPPADLTAIAKRRGGEFPAGEIARFIDGRFDLPAHGSREMPVWGERFGSDIPDAGLGESVARGNIASLVEYLKSIQQPPLAPAKKP
jgi:mono/diheme cytochrome c family protein